MKAPSIHWLLTARFNLILVLCILSENPADAQGNSLLWRITGKHLEHPSFIYGTMHSSDPRVFHFADSVLSVFEDCNAFAMEVLVDESTQATMMRNIYMENGGSLKDLLTQKQYDSVQWFAMKNAGLMISFFDRMKPLYVAMMLEVLSEQDSTEESKEILLDQFFENTARLQHKQVLGIETVEEQMGIFNVMTYHDQAELLMRSIRDFSIDTTGFELMVQYYLSNDLHKMMSFENDLSLPDSLYRALITNRNIVMASRIDSMVQQTSTFIAIGAGHLGGDQGVIALLRDKGYTVLPVIPEYSHFLKDGWYKCVSLRNRFTVEFPSIPETTIDSIKGRELWLYTLSAKDQSHLQEDLRILVFPTGVVDDDIRVYLSLKNIADIPSNNLREEKYFSFERNDKMKGHCLFMYAGDKRYVLVYASTHKSKDMNRFAGSFTIQ